MVAYRYDPSPASKYRSTNHTTFRRRSQEKGRKTDEHLFEWCEFYNNSFLIIKMMESAEMIQGYKLPNNLSSMDFNASCTHFVTGGKESSLYCK